MVALNEAAQVPAEVLAAYFGDETVGVAPLSGGEVNTNWLAAYPDSRRRVVIQRLGSMFEQEVVDDMHAATGHLAEGGWEMPQLLRTHEDDGLYVETAASGGGKPDVWRAATFIESDGRSAEYGPNSFFEFGSILAKLHGSLANLDYEPRFKIKDFHDTDLHLAKLKGFESQMPDQEAREFTHDILAAYDNLQPLPPGKDQLIHGDPRTANMLFRDGKPFTYIDWDTLMKGSIWMDVGDLMRSLVEDSFLGTGQPLELERLREFAEGYRQAAMPDAAPDEFFAWAMTGMQRITLELTARFVNDVIEQNYWAWDQVNYKSRRDYVVDRAHTQWQIYTAYQNA
ncbi:MAG TPA: aminoglycoside phosphotransferase family protein [Candidatus Saccharimonadales bacterium]|jgi:Ser/Thr protein kinase RdoA (MazF antagonist)